MEKFLEYCRCEGKIVIYCRFDKNVLIEISLSYNKDNIFYVSQRYLHDAIIMINSTILLNEVLKIVHNVRKVREIFSLIEEKLSSVDDLMQCHVVLIRGNTITVLFQI
ncbi:MAG: hypothetical protein LKM44_02520 [Wolbachia endosymbiont of Meromenopon meropis]|nr:hypothetical protein [Wolbachia endosymbiont of Meromenopon meropis]